MLLDETLGVYKDNWLDVRTIPALLIPFEATELAVWRESLGHQGLLSSEI
jgi:hypothetical protein